MAIKDKIKWNKKYTDKPSLSKNRPASSKLQIILDQLKCGKALDVASGIGRNSIHLANHGFEVDAIDISEVALDHLRSQNIANITTHLVDLDSYTPTSNNYDIIVMTNFLDRDLIPKLNNALKTNGYILIETYMDHPINEKEGSNPNFLLAKKELKSFFDTRFEIIDYDEFENEAFEMHKMMKQSIIVKKL